MPERLHFKLTDIITLNGDEYVLRDAVDKAVQALLPAGGETRTIQEVAKIARLMPSGRTALTTTITIKSTDVVYRAGDKIKLAVVPS